MHISNERLLELRNLLGLSQQEFAEKSGIKIERIRGLEADKYEMKSSELKMLGDAFDISGDYILGIDRYPHPVIHSTVESVFWSWIFSLSPEALEGLKKALKMKDEIDKQK